MHVVGYIKNIYSHMLSRFVPVEGNCGCGMLRLYFENCILLNMNSRHNPSAEIGANGEFELLNSESIKLSHYCAVKCLAKVPSSRNVCVGARQCLHAAGCLIMPVSMPAWTLAMSGHEGGTWPPKHKTCIESKSIQKSSLLRIPFE